MEPRKKKIFKYYAAPCGSNVAIYKTTETMVRIKSILRLPKFSRSPRYLDDGTQNRGAIFSQLCYIGGSLQGIIPSRQYARDVGAVPYYGLIKLNLAQKRAVRKILEVDNDE